MSKPVRTDRGQMCPLCGKDTMTIFYWGTVVDGGPGDSLTVWAAHTVRCASRCDLSEFTPPPIRE